jgi:hypothetical protein
MAGNYVFRSGRHRNGAVILGAGAFDGRLKQVDLAYCLRDKSNFVDLFFGSLNGLDLTGEQESLSQLELSPKHA